MVQFVKAVEFSWLITGHYGFDLICKSSQAGIILATDPVVVTRDYTVQRENKETHLEVEFAILYHSTSIALPVTPRLTVCPASALPPPGRVMMVSLLKYTL
jgi:hypothetical protein